MTAQFSRLLPGSLLALSALATFAQGTFLFDQQTSTDETPRPGQGNPIQLGEPGFGQAFRTTLPFIDFIRLNLNDHTVGNGIGATLLVNIRSGSITGTVMAASAPVTLLDGFAGTVNFPFPTTVNVTPGVQYFFQPFVQSGDLWNIIALPDTFYPGGPLYVHGQAYNFTALWFREGITIPEPSTAALCLLAPTALICFRFIQKRRNQNQ